MTLESLGADLVKEVVVRGLAEDLGDLTPDKPCDPGGGDLATDVVVD